MLLWENPDVTSRDRENAVPSLINTLYLVSPVLSMDCRTSGGFLRDVRRPGELGLLVLDQAEQMPAHLAPGLLYRFGKALVMGGRVRPPKEKNAEGNVLDNAESLNHLGIRMELEDAYLSLTGF